MSESGATENKTFKSSLLSFSLYEQIHNIGSKYMCVCLKMYLKWGRGMLKLAFSVCRLEW